MTFTRPELELKLRAPLAGGQPGTHEFVRAATAIVGYDDTCDFIVPAASITAEVQYNAAFTYMTLIGGGEVRGAHGIFIVTASITPVTEVILSGMGETTVFTIPDNFDDDISIIYEDSIDYVTLRDFKVDGNSANQGAGTMHGVHPFDCVRWIVENVHVIDMYGGAGIRFDGTAAYDAYHLASSCTVEDCDDIGIVFRYPNESSAVGCVSNRNLHGFANTPVGNQINFVSCIANGNVQNGFSLYGYSSVTSCTANDNARDGYAIVAGAECSLVGNLAWFNTWSGIRTTHNKNTVIGNNLNGNERHGIHIAGGDWNQIIGNICTDNSGVTAANYDGIFVEGAALLNNILCNTLQRTGAWKQRYGVNISEGAVENTKVFFNIYVTNTTAPINDAGTNTGLPSREWLVTYGTGGISLAGDVPLAAIVNGEVATVGFECPPEIQYLVRATLKVLPQATQGAANWDLDSDYGTVGEAPNTHSEADGATTYNVTDNLWYDIELVALGFFANMAIGDRGGIKLTVSTAAHDVSVFSLVFEYV